MKTKDIPFFVSCPIFLVSPPCLLLHPVTVHLSHLISIFYPLFSPLISIPLLSTSLPSSSLHLVLVLIYQEKRKLQDESEDMTERLNEELEARRKMADKLSHERHQNQKEKESTQEVKTHISGSTHHITIALCTK